MYCTAHAFAKQRRHHVDSFFKVKSKWTLNWSKDGTNNHHVHLGCRHNLHTCIKKLNLNESGQEYTTNKQTKQTKLISIVHLHNSFKCMGHILTQNKKAGVALNIHCYHSVNFWGSLCNNELEHEIT